MATLLTQWPSPEGASLRIRLYRPEDREQVLRIFRDGMEGLARAGVEELVQNNAPLQLLSLAVPAAAMLLTPSRCGMVMRAAAGLGAAAITPVAIFLLLKRYMRQYVNHSIVADLRSIETHYSPSGAGAGSAFWVAELVEPVPAAPSASASAEPSVSVASGPPQQPTCASPESDVPLPEALGTSGRGAAGEVAAAPLGPLPSKDCDGQPGAASEEPAAASEAASEAASQPADASELEVRKLVRGLVAAAVARLEGGSAGAGPAANAEVSGGAEGSGNAGSASPCRDASASGKGPLPKAAAVPAPPAGGNGPANASPPAPSTPGAAANKAAAPPPPAARSAVAVAATTTAASPPPPPPPPRTTIIGHVALERRSWQVAELRRMSVAPGYRGLGVGAQLLEALTQHARDVGFRELFLTTSGMQAPARRLYRRAGWAEDGVTLEQGVRVFTYRLDLTKKR